MYKKQQLKNGLRILTIPTKGTQAVTALVLVKTGSKYEAPKISGVSHFLEHMFFKGSKQFPTARQLSGALDLLGAEYNAFTAKEMTGFWVKVAADNIEAAVRIVGDMLRAPRFPQGEVERERGVVLEELNMFFDTPMQFVGDLWEKVLYGDQPAGRYVGGTPKTVRAITHHDIVEHFETYYRAPAIVVALAGAVTHEKAFRIASEHFRNIRTGMTPSHPSVREFQRTPQVLAHKKKTDQMHIAVGFRGISMTHPMRHAVALLAALLGGTMSSRLFVRIREELGLAYYVHTLASFDTETGSLVTLAGVRNNRAHEAVDAILKEYRRIARTAPASGEIKRAKESLIGRFVLGLEQTDELASFVAAQELLCGRVRMTEEEIRAIRRVTPKAMRDAAQLLFRYDRLNLAVIGRDNDEQAWYRRLVRAFPKGK